MKQNCFLQNDPNFEINLYKRVAITYNNSRTSFFQTDHTPKIKTDSVIRELRSAGQNNDLLRSLFPSVPHKHLLVSLELDRFLCLRFFYTKP